MVKIRSKDWGHALANELHWLHRCVDEQYWFVRSYEVCFQRCRENAAGKKFPMNVRALRFVCLELLRGHMDNINSYHELEEWLKAMRKKSRLAELWIQNLINPVLLILLYLRAEREGEFALHLYVCKQMMP